MLNRNGLRVKKAVFISDREILDRWRGDGKFEVMHNSGVVFLIGGYWIQSF